MATTTKAIPEKWKVGRLVKFCRMRNTSPHQSNLQFHFDLRECGLEDLPDPAVYRNDWGAAYVWNLSHTYLAEVCGRCGIGTTPWDAFRAACREGVDPKGLARELGVPIPE